MSVLCVCGSKVNTVLFILDCERGPANLWRKIDVNSACPIPRLFLRSFRFRLIFCGQGGSRQTRTKKTGFSSPKPQPSNRILCCLQVHRTMSSDENSINSTDSDEREIIDRMSKDPHFLQSELFRSQHTLENLEMKETEEMLKLEKKYAGLRAPIYKYRSSVIKHVPGFWCNVVSLKSVECCPPLCFVKLSWYPLLPCSSVITQDSPSY